MDVEADTHKECSEGSLEVAESKDEKVSDNAENQISDVGVKRPHDDADEAEQEEDGPPEKRSKSESGVDEEEKPVADSPGETMEVDETEEKTEDVKEVENSKPLENIEESETKTENEPENLIKAEEKEESAETAPTESVKDIACAEETAIGEDRDEEPSMEEKTSDDDKPKVNGVSSDKDSVHSEDSEKENMNVDAPMDLSVVTKPPNENGQDCIMLSDEEEDPKRFTGNQELSLEDLKLKRKMIKKLQAELRNEEAKLVLLKKLRFSQISHQMNDNIARKTPNNQTSTAQPPPLVRGNQVPGQQQPMKQAHSQAPQVQRSSNNNMAQNKGQGPPPLVMAPKQMDQRQLIEKQMKLLQEQQLLQQQRGSNTSSQQASLAGFRGTQAQADAIRQLQQAQQMVVEETPAQRQAKAKLALRKQLEKTLLQIPPPKPPPPEMNFIPNLASPDFIYLLGLEEAVNYIIDNNLISKGKKSPDEKMVCNPFTCVQCGTDFTPVWKREKPGSKNVICEQCVTSNQKKALKQEHTNRLKSAFVKALQQEQEIERMQSQELKSGTLSTSSSSSSLKEKGDRERDSRENSAARNAAAAQAYKESMAETLRQQHQNLVQAHQAAALRMGQPLGLQFNPQAPFPYQLPFAARASGLQRQYLLDMIPKGGLPWNS
ncbi:P66A-like protein [Mya arenaria]|uniref:P66A-like protein n=1 Tax=Mya arenaria TaxID=6604 RepID=A0ABY7DNQ8_MYAAR|nr:transcriptional repressor p66-beta-like [Mya arenaria]WAQ98357.1 P66A-like protein [Mya arenaria]